MTRNKLSAAATSLLDKSADSIPKHANPTPPHQNAGKIEIPVEMKDEIIHALPNAIDPVHRIRDNAS
jgi:hypothetical protein